MTQILDESITPVAFDKASLSVYINKPDPWDVKDARAGGEDCSKNQLVTIGVYIFNFFIMAIDEKKYYEQKKVYEGPDIFHVTSLVIKCC